MIATQGPRGADVSPRGDPPGFVRILDDATLLLPDRVGNNRLDGMTNLLANPRIGMLFFVPGMNETLRINGTARISDDARLLAAAQSTAGPEDRPRHRRAGGVPALRQGAGEVGAVDPSRHIDRASLPSYADMLLAHVGGLTPEENERQTKVMTARGLY